MSAAEQYGHVARRGKCGRPHDRHRPPRSAAAPSSPPANSPSRTGTVSAMAANVPRGGAGGQHVRVHIPADVAELTPDWFTVALDRRAPGTAVTAVEVVETHAGTTGRARVRLSYRGDTTAPETLFVKMAPPDPRQRAFVRHVGIGVAEARLYASLGDALPVRAPGVWHADFNDDGGFVMVLEDLVPAGCRFPRPRDPDVAERARSTIEELAHLHGTFWESDRLGPGGDLAWVPDRAGFGAGGGKDAGA